MKKVILVMAAMMMVVGAGVGAARAEEPAEVPAGYEEIGPPISAMMKPEEKGFIKNSVSFLKETAGSVNPEFSGRFYLRGGQFSQKVGEFKHDTPFAGLGAEGEIRPMKSIPVKLLGKIEGDTSFGDSIGYQSFAVEGGAGVEIAEFVPFLNEVYSSVLPFYTFGHKHWILNKKQDDYLFDTDRPFESTWDTSYHRAGMKISTNIGGWSIGLNGGVLMPTRAKNNEIGKIDFMVGEEIKTRTMLRMPKIDPKTSYFGGIDVKKGRFVGGFQYEGLRFDSTGGGETSNVKNDTFTLKVGWEF